LIFIPDYENGFVKRCCPPEGDSRMKIQDFVSLVLVEYPSVVDDGNVDD
jgi:hypothetical protein